MPSLQTQAEALVVLTWNRESDILSDSVNKRYNVLFCHCECSEASSDQVGDCFLVPRRNDSQINDKADQASSARSALSLTLLNL